MLVLNSLLSQYFMECSKSGFLNHSHSEKNVTCVSLDVTVAESIKENHQSIHTVLLIQVNSLMHGGRHRKDKGGVEANGVRGKVCKTGRANCSLVILPWPLPTPPLEGELLREAKQETTPPWLWTLQTDVRGTEEIPLGLFTGYPDNAVLTSEDSP